MNDYINISATHTTYYNKDISLTGFDYLQHKQLSFCLKFFVIIEDGDTTLNCASHMLARESVCTRTAGICIEMKTFLRAKHSSLNHSFPHTLFLKSRKMSSASCIYSSFSYCDDLFIYATLVTGVVIIFNNVSFVITITLLSQK